MLDFIVKSLLKFFFNVLPPNIQNLNKYFNIIQFYIKKVHKSKKKMYKNELN